MPSGSVVAEATVLPSFTASTRIPASAFSPASIVPAVPPPPRLKSIHTVPVTFPATSRAGIASLAPRTSSGFTATSGSAAAAPARTVDFVVNAPPPLAARSAFGRGRAPG